MSFEDRGQYRQSKKRKTTVSTKCISDSKTSIESDARRTQNDTSSQTGPEEEPEIIDIKKEAGSGNEMQRKTTIPKRVYPQISDHKKNVGKFINAELKKYNNGKAKRVPNATAICEKMSRLREKFLRKEGGHLELLKLSVPKETYSNELPPEPPLEVKTVLCASYYTNVQKVYWKPPEKDHQIDGYKVMTSEDGQAWSVKKVVNKRKHCAIGLKPALKIGVCSYRGKQDSKLIVSENVGNKSLAADSFEWYEGSSFIDLRMNSVVLTRFVESQQRLDVPACNVKMVPMMMHKVLCTPLKLTPLSLGLRCLAESKHMSQISSSKFTIANSAKSIKYCFTMEEELVSVILDSKDPAFATYGVQVLLRFCLHDQSSIQEDRIPDCIVRINNDIALIQFKDKHSGPLDITHMCNFTEGIGSKDCLSVEWMPSSKNHYCVTICVAEKLTIPGIVSNLMMYNVKDSSTTKEMVTNKFENNKYVSCTALKASLICPLGKTRLVSPCRGSNCTHIQCMDALTLLKMNEGRPLSKKKCFMCDEPVGDLYIDGLFLEILSSIPESVTEIELKEDGSWLYEENDETHHAASCSSPINIQEQIDPLCDLDTNNITTSHKESESEEDIYVAMKSHLSRLKLQVDKLEYLSKQHESIKEKIDCSETTGESGDKTVIELLDEESPKLVDLTRDFDQGPSDSAGNSVEEVKKTEKIDSVETDNLKGSDGVIEKMLGCNVSDHVDLTFDDEQKRENMSKPSDYIRIDRKDDIIKHCKEKINDSKTNNKINLENYEKNQKEKKIDSAIAKMLKKLKKPEEISDRQQGYVSNDDAERDIPFVVIENDEDTDDEDDIVEIDMSSGTLKIVEDSDGSVMPFKEDGTLDEFEVNKSGNGYVANLVVPNAGKSTEEQDNDVAEATGKKQYPQMKSILMSNRMANYLNVLNKCEKNSSHRYQKDTDKDKMSTSDCGMHYSRKKCGTLKPDGTLDDPELSSKQDILLPSIALKEEEIDQKLRTVYIDIHTDKCGTETYEEQNDNERDDLKTDQGISCVIQETDPDLEQKHKHYIKIPSEIRFNCARTEEETSSTHPGLRISTSQTNRTIGCLEPDRRRSTEQSDDVRVFPKKKTRKRRMKSMVDRITELPEEHMIHQILFDAKMAQKKADLAPPTKELMRIGKSGIKRKLGRSNAVPQFDVLKRPCLPLTSSRLRRFCEKKLCAKEDKSCGQENIEDAFVLSELEVEETNLYKNDKEKPSLDVNDLAETDGKSDKMMEKQNQYTLTVEQCTADLQEAIDAVGNKTMSVREASGKFGVPSCTIEQMLMPTNQSTRSSNKDWSNQDRDKQRSDRQVEQCTDDLQEAIDAVGNKTMPVREASGKYGVPSCTIEQMLTPTNQSTCSSNKDWSNQDRDKQRSNRQGCNIQGSYKQVAGLSLEENAEKDLTKFIEYYTEHCFVSSDMVSSLAKQILRRYGLKDIDCAKYQAHFVQIFKVTHPEIDNTMISENGAGFEEYASRWFSTLKRILSEYGLKNKSDRIYSCGRFRLTPGCLVNTLYKCTRQNIAVWFNACAQICICADGRVLPPVVTSKGKLQGQSDHCETFLEWFKTCFIPNCGKERPVCLLMTYRTHQLTLKLVKTAIENNVVLIGLPHIAVNVLQPLEARIFEPLKVMIQSKCCPKNTDLRFPVVLSDVIKQIAPSTVKEAFQVTGICPLGKAAKRVDKMVIHNQLCSDDMEKVSTPQNNLKGKISGLEEIEQLGSSIVTKIEEDPEVRKTDGNSGQTNTNYQVHWQHLPEVLEQEGLQPRRTSSRACGQQRSNLHTSIVERNASKPEHLNINSRKGLQKSPKRKFADMTKNPFVYLKRKKVLDINGHSIYV